MKKLSELQIATHNKNHNKKVDDIARKFKVPRELVRDEFAARASQISLLKNLFKKEQSAKFSAPAQRKGGSAGRVASAASMHPATLPDGASEKKQGANYGADVSVLSTYGEKHNRDRETGVLRQTHPAPLVSSPIVDEKKKKPKPVLSTEQKATEFGK